MDNLIWNLLLESIFDVKKWSNWKYAITGICVFSVRLLPKLKKLIPKADLEWECPYIIFVLFCSKSVGQYLKRQKNGFTLVFSKSD